MLYVCVVNYFNQAVFDYLRPGGSELVADAALFLHTLLFVICHIIISSIYFVHRSDSQWVKRL